MKEDPLEFVVRRCNTLTYYRNHIYLLNIRAQTEWMDEVQMKEFNRERNETLYKIADIEKEIRQWICNSKTCS